MKYLFLPALILCAFAAVLAGCGNDITHSHDIYREHYIYKPLPQQEEEAAPAPKVAPVAPPTE